MTAVAIRGTTYPVLLPKLRDPRLHLAATIISLQVIGQVGFHFDLSIAQILISLATCAVLEVAIAFRTQKVLMWPASALLTGNGVAFVLRVPGTQHGDWWSTRGWQIYAGTAAFSLLSKHIIKWKGEHIFNPSNIGLVACFLLLGRARATPLDFWWGPMSFWLALALGIILLGGFTILSRLKLLRVALCFWATFAVGIGVLAASGHAMLARWHLGPISGFHFWLILVTSPEVLVFLFFMITDPKTAPRSPANRVIYAVSLGLLASLMIAPTTSEYAAKVALLGSLAVVCLAIPILRALPVALDRRLAPAALAAIGAAVAGMVVFSSGGSAAAARPLPTGGLPPISIQASHGVQTQLDRRTAELIAHDLLGSVHATTADRLTLHLAPGRGQDPPFAVARLAGRTYELHQQAGGDWALAAAAVPEAMPQRTSSKLRGLHLENIAPALGLDFQQGSFRYGISNDSKAMMGGGVCWLDYNGDGWQDLFAVNSYASSDSTHALPTSQLYENVDGSFRNVTAKTHAGLAAQGDGCVAADLNGDGRTDLVVTTASGVDILWNHGGTFTRAQLPASGWYTGATVADVDGDGRPDLFVSGYSDLNAPVADSLAGFPTNVGGVRDLLFLNRGNGRFREVGAAAGLESARFSHGLGAAFVDVNGDGRPDLYVANDEDPNELYVNVPWPGGAAADPAGLGFRFEQRAAAAGVADPYAGMGIATSVQPNGRLGLFVTNSRNEPSAAYSQRSSGGFANARPLFAPALGTGFAGWGATWADLTNSGTPDLLVAAGAIPVTSLKGDAESLRVLAPTAHGYGSATGVLGTSLKLNGRGVAAADVANDGRVDVAVNTIGGKLVLLHPTGASGHWLDVALSRFAPGAVVTVTLPDGRRLSRVVQAGSSYLSSEDERAHFGLGAATSVRSVSVRVPWGGVTRVARTNADRVITVRVPAPAPQRRPAVTSPLVSTCTPRSLGGRSVARFWNDTAVDVLRIGQASQPVQARDLFDLSQAIATAFQATHGDATAISYAAYRLLVWQASYNANLDRTFALLGRSMRQRCLAPGYLGGAGNRIASAAIAASRSDGSNEAQHFADTTYVPANQPLVVTLAGSTVHDATFWQPLALSVKAAQGGGSVPAAVQTFQNAQWGGVRTFAPRVDVKLPRLADPSTKAYRTAALAAVRASTEAAPRVDASPVGWNALLPSHGLARDVRVDLALNAALNDAAVAAWRAKRVSNAPRPISMVRYLAFNGRLPAQLDRWNPSAPTPASPGGVSSDAAFAAAASRVLGALVDRPFSAHAAAAARQGVATGTELAGDETAGTKVGAEVARRVLAKLRAG